MQTRVGRRVSIGAAIPALAASFALAGCATSLSDPDGLVKQLYRENTGVSASSVSCPTGIPLAKGHQFMCTVQAQGVSRDVTLLELTTSGQNVKIIGVN